jgi:TP901 family phage tail tape measure protein
MANQVSSELVFTAKDQTGAAFQQLTRQMRSVTSAADQMARTNNLALTRLSGGVLGFERRLTQATAFMTAGLEMRKAFTDFADFDRRLTRIRQNAGVTQEVFGGMREEILTTAQETALAADKVTDGFEAIVRATGDFDLAKKHYKEVAVATQAMNADMTDTAKTAEIFLNTLKMDPKDLTKGFDAMAYAANQGKFEAADFAHVMPELGAQMAAAGYMGLKGFKDMAAMLQIVRKGSGDSEEAFRSMRDLLSKMVSPEMEKRFLEVGRVDLASGMAKSVREGRNTVGDFIKMTDQALENIAGRRGISNKDKERLLPQLLPEQDSRRATLMLLTLRKLYRELRGDMDTKIDGTILNQIADVSDDTAANLQRLKNSWWAAEQAMGKALVDMGAVQSLENLRQTLDDVTGSLKTFTDFASRLNTSPGVAIGEGAYNLGRRARTAVEEFRTRRADEQVTEARDRIAQHREELASPDMEDFRRPQLEAEIKRVEALIPKLEADAARAHQELEARAKMNDALDKAQGSEWAQRQINERSDWDIKHGRPLLNKDWRPPPGWTPDPGIPGQVTPDAPRPPARSSARATPAALGASTAWSRIGPALGCISRRSISTTTTRAQPPRPRWTRFATASKPWCTMCRCRPRPSWHAAAARAGRSAACCRTRAWVVAALATSA